LWRIGRTQQDDYPGIIYIGQLLPKNFTTPLKPYSNERHLIRMIIA